MHGETLSNFKKFGIPGIVSVRSLISAMCPKYSLKSKNRPLPILDAVFYILYMLIMITIIIDNMYNI